MTDTRSLKGKTKLFSLRLKNKQSGSSIVAQFFCPTKEKKYLSEHKVWAERWDCVFIIRFDRERKAKVASGHNWLGALLSAVEYVRMQIPENADCDWQDEKQVDSWVILPKRIPFSWGYPLYRKISDLSNSEEAKHIAKIDRRRVASESKRRTRTNK